MCVCVCVCVRERERERNKGERKNKTLCKRHVTRTLSTHFITISLFALSFIVFVVYPLRLAADASPGPGVELVLVQKFERQSLKYI